MSLDQEIADFVNDDLPPLCKSLLHEYVTISEDIQLAFSDDIHSHADIRPTEKGVKVHISTFFIRRLTIILILIRSSWQVNDTDPQVHTVNLQNAYDSYFFLRPEGSRWNFSVAPELAPLFTNDQCDEAVQEAISNFCSEFTLRQEARRIHEPDKSILNFHLPTHLDNGIKNSIRNCCRFILLHEIAHVKRSHAKMSTEIEHGMVRRYREKLTVNSYVSKACEIDADTQSFVQLIEWWTKNGKPRTSYDMFQLLNDIFLLISATDICRLSIAEYNGVHVTHPAPDVRAVALVLFAIDYYRERNPRLAFFLAKTFHTSIIYLTKSFQKLCVSAGAFYLIANKFATIDRKFFPEAFIWCQINDELQKIDHELQGLWERNGEDRQTLSWRYVPIGYTYETFIEAARNYLVELFKSNDQASIDDKIAGDLTDYIKNTERGGKKLIVTFLNDEWRTLYANIDQSKICDTQNTQTRRSLMSEHLRLVNLTMDRLFAICDVKIELSK